MSRYFLVGLILLVPGLFASPISGGQEVHLTIDNAPRGEDGRFENLNGEIKHGSLAVRFPFILRRFGTYFRAGDGAPETVANDGAFLRENARHSIPTVTWVGHATLLVQMQRVTFLTDPTWSDRPSPVPLIGPSRYVPPGLAIEDLPPIDFVIISHNHYDHLDLPTLTTLAKRRPETVFYVPLGNEALLRKHKITNVKALDWGQRAVFQGVTVHCLPAQHWSKRSFNDDRRALWSSWAVTSKERRFYFAGDTGYFPEFKTIGRHLGPFDLVALPIGAYAPRAMMAESHMNPEEALQAAIDLKAKHALGIHFGTFDLSDEPLAEPPERFKSAAVNAQFEVNDTWVFDIGETRAF